VTAPAPRAHRAVESLGRPQPDRGLLVAATPGHFRNDEEKEGTTMPRQQAVKRVSAKQVAIDALRAADQPLKAKEIAKRVIESGRCSSLKGKTPEATISAMLAVGSKSGGPFKRVDKGTYTLAERNATSTPTAQAEPATATRPRQARKPAQAQKAKRQRTKPRPTQSR
jgi:hypothetical protein